MSSYESTPEIITTTPSLSSSISISSVPTMLPTTPTMSGFSSATSDGDSEEGEYIYPVMAFVVGAVTLIIAIVILVFFIKSRRRRTQTVRIYREHQERPPTVSLEIIDRDREENIPETLNGVQNSLYCDDSILPIDVFDSQAHRDQVSIQQPCTVQIAEIDETHAIKQENETNEANEMKDETSPQRDNIATVSTSVYENTKFSTQRLLVGSDKLKQLSMPNLNEDTKCSLQKRSNSQKQTRTVSINSDYETAFPMLVNKSKTEFGEVDKNSAKVKTDKAEPKSVTDDSTKHAEHTGVADMHTVKEDVIIGTKHSKATQESSKPKVKPKPNIKRLGNIISHARSPKKHENVDENHDYENSLEKIKKANLKEARFLKTVPPPCNTNTYVNVPGSPTLEHTGESCDYVNVPDKNQICHAPGKKRESNTYANVSGKPSNNPSSNDSIQRQSSEYEDTGGVRCLKKDAKVKSKLPELKKNNPTSNDSIQRQSSEYEDSERLLSLNVDAKGKSKLPEPKNDKQVNHKKYEGSKRGETRPYATASKAKYLGPKSRLPVLKTKQSGQRCKEPELKAEFNDPEAKLYAQKPVYANVAVKGRSISEIPDRKDFDYENEDTVNELKSTLKRLGKRGFSTSSLETCRQEKKWRTGLSKTQNLSVPKACKITDDDLYLRMDAGINDENPYLQMDLPSDDVYMRMVTPEDDDVYMPMKNTYSTGSKTTKEGDEDLNFARTYIKCPKPCGGNRSATYTNYSEQPTKYANIFRSRSTDNVYSYARTKPFIKF